ncbi:hypothetical protein [Planococcus sp. ISL-110]|uniref:hypothetical protein n=1 Tax=Planococcus sp. ISL-110 TaxID=2819167 RepID=UPI001BE855E9|nr:hypothetical protein [Planococcus sp. ISL-110]MBT2571527.1 hypothetical protein [Planococcus sp. ISL-110]
MEFKKDDSGTIPKSSHRSLANENKQHTADRVLFVLWKEVMDYKPSIYFNNISFSIGDVHILKEVTGSLP